MRLVSVTQVPPLPAEPQAVLAVADRIHDTLGGARDGASRASRRWRDLGAAYDTPETATAVSVLHPIGDAIDEWADAAGTAADALSGYAYALAAQKAEVEALREEIPSFRAAVRAFAERRRADLGPDIDDAFLYDPWHVQENERLRMRCSAASAALELAAETCAAELARIGGPATILPAASPARVDDALVAFDTAVGTAILDALVRAAGPGADAEAVAAFLAAHPEYAGVLSHAAPEPRDIASWWAGIGGAASPVGLALVVGASVVVGGLDGVPAGDRVLANRHTAERRIADARSELATLEERLALFEKHGREDAAGPFVDAIAARKAEIRYLEAVARGDRTLYLYDPARDRIIEMIGDPASARHVVTFVPGTGADAAQFHAGTVQRVSQFLVERDLDGSTVAFVYKDGAWASWGLPWDDTSNANKDFAMAEGRQLAAFQDGIQVDPTLRSAQRIGIAHSAGMSILSSSEVAGARYDQVVSLAGSWLQDGWSPHAQTEYDHYQYGMDAINLLEPFYDTPHESPQFEQHIQEGTTLFGVPRIIDHHNRVAEGPERNVDVLRGIYREIHD